MPATNRVHVISANAPSRLSKVRVEFPIMSGTDPEKIAPLLTDAAAEMTRIAQADVSPDLKISRARALAQRLADELRHIHS